MPDAPLTEEQKYRASPRLNHSSLKLMGVSPAHFKLGYTGEATGSMDFGTAVHTATLEPERFAAEYISTGIRQDNRTKVWQEFQADATRNGKSILSDNEMVRVKACRDAIMAKPAARRYLEKGRAEVGMEWTINGDGFSFDCKGRADWLSPLATVDLKTTQCASKSAFAASCAKYSYYSQAAFYSDGRALALRERLPFVFIAVESAPPHIVTVFTVPEKLIDYGRDLYVSWLARLDYCQKNNFWGGYEEAETVELTLPRWMENDQ